MEHSLKHRLFTGALLKPLHVDALKFSRQMKEFKVQKPYDCTCFGLQTIMNLIGESKFTSKLCGTVVDANSKLDKYLKTNNNLSLAVMRLFQYHLAFAFDDFEHSFVIRAQPMGLESQIEKTAPGQFGLCVMYYSNAMAAISLYRKAKSFYYWRIARKLSKKIHGWAKDGVSERELYFLRFDGHLKGFFAEPQYHSLLHDADRRVR